MRQEQREHVLQRCRKTQGIMRTDAFRSPVSGLVCREMVHQGVDGPQHKARLQIKDAPLCGRQKTVLFHPDYNRRLRILTESADPKHWALAGWRKPAGRRITAGGDFHPALRNLVQLTPRKAHVQVSGSAAAAPCVIILTRTQAAKTVASYQNNCAPGSFHEPGATPALRHRLSR